MDTVYLGFRKDNVQCSQQVSRIMRLVGTALGGLCIALNLWASWRYGSWNLSLASVGCFLMYSASAGTATRAMTELRRFIDRKILLDSRGYIGCAWVAVIETISLQRAVSLLHPSRYTMFCVAERGTGRLLETLSEQDVMAAAMNHPSGTMEAAMAASGENVERARKRY